MYVWVNCQTSLSPTPLGPFFLSYAQRMKRALLGKFSHFQFLTFFNRYMFKLLICVLFVLKLYMSVLKYGFV